MDGRTKPVKELPVGRSQLETLTSFIIRADFIDIHPWRLLGSFPGHMIAHLIHAVTFQQSVTLLRREEAVVAADGVLEIGHGALLQQIPFAADIFAARSFGGCAGGGAANAGGQRSRF